MPTVLDTGYIGQTKSLSGVLGSSGMGLVCQIESVALPTSTNTQVMQSNPSRKWALLQNINASDITVFFGDVAASGVAGIRLPRYGTIQIDENLPWCGAMTAFQDSGSTINLFVMESSVQP